MKNGIEQRRRTGKKLVLKLLELKATPVAIATRAAVTVFSVSRWKNGRSPPSRQHIAALESYRRELEAT